MDCTSFTCPEVPLQTWAELVSRKIDCEWLEQFEQTPRQIRDKQRRQRMQGIKDALQTNRPPRPLIIRQYDDEEFDD